MPVAPFAIKPSYDSDASAYFTTAGVTSTAGRQQVSRFVTGIKDLGLWNSMVCWPLRSSQNAGTGTTAYSLGGLGTFNGTLNNSPTWTANGIQNNNTNQSMTVPDDPNVYNLRSCMAVFNPSSSSINQRLFDIQDDATAQGWYCLFLFDGGSGGERGAKIGLTRNSNASMNAPNTENVDLGVWRASSFTASNTSDNLFRNGSLVSNSARTGLATINPTGSRNGRRVFGVASDLIGAFCIISTATWTNGQVGNIYSLYKSTLGQGLGLP